MQELNTKNLIDVAMGRLPADLVIQNGNWICVQSGEFVPGTDIAIHNGRIAYVGPDASHALGKDTVVIEAEGRYLVPGLLDGHMHVESGMLTVTEFVRAVLPHGTTGMFIDPHEIANVFGLKGVRLFADEALQQPIHVWLEIPSCVPSAPGLETSGGELSIRDISEALTWEGVIGLGEMMDYPGVVAGNEPTIAKMVATRNVDKVIGGHYAEKDLGLSFHGYVAGGPEDDHEGTGIDDAIARLRQGMKVMLRYGSAWQDLAAQGGALTRLGLDSRHCILCTDDSQAETIVSDGHMDRVVRHAISQGISPMTVLQMATINTAEHFGLAREIGQIAPGRWADILIVDDLMDFHARLVLAKGQLAARNGDLLMNMPVTDYPDWAYKSVRLERPLQADDFIIPIENPSANVKVNVIGVVENKALTRHLIFDIIPEENEIKTNLNQGLAKLAVVERYCQSGNTQLGLVAGFGFTESCAVASTVAHDSHQLLVVGTSDTDMTKAVNKLAEIGGGQVVVKDGQIIGLVELPIGGIISNLSADQVAIQAKTVLDGFLACGCKLNNANMTLSLLALVVIPELRLSDKGLVDVSNHKFIPLFETKNLEDYG